MQTNNMTREQAEIHYKMKFESMSRRYNNSAEKDGSVILDGFVNPKAIQLFEAWYTGTERKVIIRQPKARNNKVHDESLAPIQSNEKLQNLKASSNS